MVASDLQDTLRSLEPTLDELEYVFVSTPERSGIETLSAFARGFFVEEEGVTFIIRSVADSRGRVPNASKRSQTLHDVADLVRAVIETIRYEPGGRMMATETQKAAFRGSRRENQTSLAVGLCFGVAGQLRRHRSNQADLRPRCNYTAA